MNPAVSRISWFYLPFHFDEAESHRAYILEIDGLPAWKLVGAVFKNIGCIISLGKLTNPLDYNPMLDSVERSRKGDLFVGIEAYFFKLI